MEQNDPLSAVIAALNAQRPLLGDAAVDAAIAALRPPAAPPPAPPPPARPDWSGERKLVTIMFADISGFTALSERLDPEEVRSLMNACFDHLVPVVEHYGGTVDKFIGDEIMALFGAPLALENHAEQALLAALEMMDSLAELTARRRVDLRLHFGINTGVVVSGGIGSANRQQYSVMGDAVNLASRLEDLSEAGQLLVGPLTHRLTTSLFDFQPLPPVRVKGKAEPVAVFQLLGRKQTHAATRGLAGLRAPLVGRDAEREQLRAALRRAIAGQGSIVTIAGEPGLGKSRLVSEVWDEFADELTWAEGRALSYTGGMSYWMARDMARCFIGASPNDSPAETAIALRQTATALFGPRLAEVYPFMSQIAETPLEPDMQVAVSELSPAALRGRLQRAFGEWVRALCARGPLALIWEDLHWADNSSLELIATLLPLAAELPLVILLVYRQTEGDMDAWWARVRPAAAPVETIVLRRLSDTAGADLLGQLLNVEALPEAARRLILSKAEGNPFFLEEVLRSLVDAGRILIDGARVVATAPISQLDVPDTLQGVIAARIDRLAPDVKHTLQLASVVGRIFQQPVLAYLYGQETDRPTPEPELGALIQREMIRPRTETEFIFKHALTHEVTYNSLLLARRKELHAVAAAAIETLFAGQTDELAATLAYHYQRAGNRTQAVDHLLLAGERAQQTYANAEAVTYLQAALDELDAPGWPEDDPRRDPLRLAALEQLGDVLATTGNYDASRATYARGLALTPPAQRIDCARWSRKTAQSYLRQRFYQEATTHLDSATEALGATPAGDPLWHHEAIWILLNRIYVGYWTNNLPLMLESLEPARAEMAHYGDAEQRVELERMELTAVWQRHRFLLDDRATAVADAHLAAARRFGRLEAIAWALTMRGMTAYFFYPRHLDEAARYLQEGMATAERAGSLDVRLVGLCWLTGVNRARGDVATVKRLVQDFLPQTENAPFYRGVALAHLAWTELREGNHEAARANALKSLDLLASDRRVRYLADVVLARLDTLADDLASAVQTVVEMSGPARGWRLPDPIVERYQIASAAWQAKQPDVTRAELNRAFQLSEELGYA